MCFIPNRDEAWMKQIARNLTDAEDGCLVGKRYVVMDRDGKFRPAFRAILKTERVEAVLLPPRSPNLNAHLERFHRSLKVECTRRLQVSFRAETFRQELLWFAACYNQHRPHAALGGRTPDEVYFPQRPASQSPRFEPRALWPRPAPCALPQVLVKGEHGLLQTATAIREASCRIAVWRAGPRDFPTDRARDDPLGVIRQAARVYR